MKKVLILSIMLVMSCSLMAQFSVGPKIGYLTSKLSSDKDNIKSDLKNNFMFGVFARIGDKFYIQPEINYYKTGSTFQMEDGFEIGGITDPQAEVKMKNIQIPIYLGYRIADFKVLDIRAQVGPTATFVIDNETSWKGATSQVLNEVSDFNVKNVQWGLQFGAGIDVLMFTLDVQYYLGLSNAIDKLNINLPLAEDRDFSSKNQGWMVTLGWKIL